MGGRAAIPLKAKKIASVIKLDVLGQTQMKKQEILSAELTRPQESINDYLGLSIY